jgi:hypothetical protein
MADSTGGQGGSLLKSMLEVIGQKNLRLAFLIRNKDAIDSNVRRVKGDPHSFKSLTAFQTGALVPVSNQSKAYVMHFLNGMDPLNKPLLDCDWAHTF